MGKVRGCESSIHYDVCSEGLTIHHREYSGTSILIFHNQKSIVIALFPIIFRFFNVQTIGTSSPYCYSWI